MTIGRMGPVSLLRWLTSPNPSVREIEPRRYSQMLLLLALFQIPFVIITVIVAIVVIGNGLYAEAFFLIPATLLVTYSTAYGLGKIGRWRAGALTLVAPIYIGIWAAIIRKPELTYIGFEIALGLLLLPVLLTGFFFPLRVLAITAAGNVVASLFIPMLLGVPLASFMTTLIIIGALSIIAIIAIYHRDMIERERMAEVQERESRLAKTEKMARIGSWEWDLSTDELTWSSEEYRILGFNIEYPITLGMFMDRVHPDDRDRVDQVNQAFKTAEHSVITEYRIVHPELGERHIFSIAEPVRNDQGDVVKVVGFEQDVTEQVSSREELRKAKEAAEEALSQVKQLQGFLPICSYCKKIRRDDDAWQQLEQYITEHSGAEFSHGVCPECYAEHVEPQLAGEKMQPDQSGESPN